MLRSILDHRRFIADTGQMFWVTGWKAIVFAALNMEQLAKRVAIRQPGGALLLGRKKVSMLIKGERAGKPRPRVPSGL